jgi:hypothetical protein
VHKDVLGCPVFSILSCTQEPRIICIMLFHVVACANCRSSYATPLHLDECAVHIGFVVPP